MQDRSFRQTDRQTVMCRTGHSDRLTDGHVQRTGHSDRLTDGHVQDRSFRQTDRHTDGHVQDRSFRQTETVGNVQYN